MICCLNYFKFSTWLLVLTVQHSYIAIYSIQKYINTDQLEQYFFAISSLPSAIYVSEYFCDCETYTTVSHYEATICVFSSLLVPEKSTRKDPRQVGVKKDDDRSKRKL